METTTWEPPPQPQRGYVYRWDPSACECMHVHEATGRTFHSLPPLLPDPWLPVFFYDGDDTKDYVCENTELPGPYVYSVEIPTTPHGWKAAWDHERELFLFYEDREGTGYYNLHIPFLLSKIYLPQQDTYTKKHTRLLSAQTTQTEEEMLKTSQIRNNIFKTLCKTLIIHYRNIICR